MGHEEALSGHGREETEAYHVAEASYPLQTATACHVPGGHDSRVFYSSMNTEEPRLRPWPAASCRK